MLYRLSHLIFFALGLSGSLSLALAQPVGGEVHGFFPQFVLGGGVQSTVVLVNPSNEQVEGTVEFFDRLGNQFPVVIGQVYYSSGQAPFLLPPGGTVFMSPETGDWPLETGWVRVRAYRDVRANILYSGATGQAGLPAVQGGLDFAIPVDSRTGAARTGLALAVPDAEQVIARLTLVQANGQPAPNGETTLDLDAHSQLAAHIDELLPQADLSDFRGSLRIQSDARIALAALHITPTELSPLPVEPLEQTHFFSFEDNLFGWRPRAFDVDDGAVADWDIAPSVARARDGKASLLFFLDNLTDAGKIFIQRPFLVEPDTSYEVKVSYSFATQDYGSINLWRIITGVSAAAPATPDDLVFQGETGHGSPNDIGYVWLDKSYEFDVESGPDGLLFVYVGVWGTWETPKGHYFDRLLVTIRKAPPSP